MSALEVIPSAVPLQEISIAQPKGEAYLDESVEFGDVSAETRELVRPNLIVLKKPIRKRPRPRCKTDWEQIAKRLQQTARNFKWLGNYFEKSAICIARDAKKNAVRG